MKERVLLISRSVPPETSGSAVIVGNLAKQFSAWEMLVAGERPYRRPPVVWYENWPALHYISAGWPEARRGARWTRRLQTPLIFWRCLRLARTNRCSIILAVFPIEEYLFAAYLTALLTGARFFAYFHNTYLDNRSGDEAVFARWLQARVFARAEHTFVMSEGMVELFRERYPNVICSALVHSFNEPLPDFAPPSTPGSPLRLTLCGSISESCRDATVRVCEAIFQSPETHLTILSGTSRSYLESLGLMREEVCCETVSRDEIIERLSEADIVVLPHGLTGERSDAEYQTIFPTRVIEYLICGRPILAHSPSDCFLTRFLRAHDCALIVDQPSHKALHQAIERLRTDADLRAHLVQNALSAARQFQAVSVAATLRSFLERSATQ